MIKRFLSEVNFTTGEYCIYGNDENYSQVGLILKIELNQGCEDPELYIYRSGETKIFLY